MAEDSDLEKTEDPSFDKNFPYIYRKGYVAMLSTSYSRSGMSLLLQAKRSDNMGFRSKRTENGTAAFINHLPAFAFQQTYALAALYPYATQFNGEWAYQAEFGYKFKRHTALGGKYGTSLKLNFSHVHSIEQNKKKGGGPGTDGYGSAFWKWGDKTYYQDLNVQIEKKLTKDFKLNLMYMNQYYNKTVVEGEGGMIHSDIFVAEGKYRFNKLDFGDIEGLPRLIDAGQCNDAYSAIILAVTLAEKLGCGVNDLPLSLVLSWFEQKAIVILLTLLSLGVKNIVTGPTAPGFFTPDLLAVLNEKFGLRSVTTVEEDMKQLLSA